MESKCLVKPKMHVVFAIYGKEGLAALKKMPSFLGLISSKEFDLGDVYIVSTDKTHFSAKGMAKESKISFLASNRFHDWSAYADGVRKLLARGLGSGDAILVCNQTLFSKYPWKWCLKKIVAYSKFLKTPLPAICGFRDGYGFLIDSHPQGGNSGQVSCFCATMNLRTAELLVANDEAAAVAMPDEASASWERFGTIPFPVQIREFCRMFVSSRDTHFKWIPSVRTELSEAALARKAAALLLEHELTASVSSAGGLVADIAHETVSKVFFLLWRRFFLAFGELIDTAQLSTHRGSK